jgi:hypothetical protein
VGWFCAGCFTTTGPAAAGLFDGGSSVVEYRELPAGDRSPNYRPPNM